MLNGGKTTTVVKERPLRSSLLIHFPSSTANFIIIIVVISRKTFYGTWYLQHSWVHYDPRCHLVFMSQLLGLLRRRKFSDSAINKSYIAYFSMRMRNTSLFRSEIWRHHRVPRYCAMRMRKTVYFRSSDAACCYRQSSVICLLACNDNEPCKNGSTDRDAIWVVDSGGPKEPCIR